MPPRELRQRRANQIERIAEQPSVERQWLQRTPGERRTLEFRAIVGMTGISAQFYIGMIFQNLDCRGTCLQEGRAQRNVGMVSDDLLQISLDVHRPVGRAHSRCMVCVGYPDRSRRQRRRSTEIFSLLDQQRSGAPNSGEQRSRHARSARADDDDVITARNLG